MIITPAQDEIDVSLIVPVFNEGDSLPQLHRQIVAAMDPLAVRWQVVYVDDGSRDQSFQILSGIAQRDLRASVVQFRRNFGQTAAIAAGIDNSSGKVIVLLDGDLQNDPADIPRLLEKLDEGYDMVSGWRKDRKEPFWQRRLPSIIANSIISAVTGVRLHDYGCTLKAYRREVLEHVHLYGEMHRLIPVYAATVGARIIELPVNDRPRRFGRSKYGIGRTMKVILDLLTTKFLSSYVTKPIYVFGGSGLVLAGIGVVLSAVVLYQKIWLDTWVHRNPLAWIAGFSFISGLQLVLMGLLAELIVRTYHESQSKPIYVVRQVINHRKDAPGVRHIGVRG
jgi:glycosyltransferase involved in cell wall biosynthesis